MFGRHLHVAFVADPYMGCMSTTLGRVPVLLASSPADKTSEDCHCPMTLFKFCWGLADVLVTPWRWALRPKCFIPTWTSTRESLMLRWTLAWPLATCQEPMALRNKSAKSLEQVQILRLKMKGRWSTVPNASDCICQRVMKLNPRPQEHVLFDIGFIGFGTLLEMQLWGRQKYSSPSQWSHTEDHRRNV